MRSFLAVLLLSLTAACSSSKFTAQIPAQDKIELSYSDYPMYEATLKSKGLANLGVTVIDAQSGEQIRGFGSPKIGKESIVVEAENLLIIDNPNAEKVKVKLSYKEYVKKEVIRTKTIINFSLINTSEESIPLIIPSVMNPNLSPNSRSGVSLAIGQEILFRVKGKNYNLLTVTEKIANDSEIDVFELLADRKKELGLK